MSISIYAHYVYCTEISTTHFSGLTTHFCNG